ncbi:AAA family ATPase [Nonomuraea typhae]|uniref:AAA family ATPase n=1 Tax=Nonomuraea typhae TaxID=2603600 RepID=UPI001FE6C35B|nr:AAA family ATPase [Nonomuraea typhae]
MSERFIVLTGGPGSGKSTLIDRLEAAGYAGSEEAGRAIIRDQSAIGGRALPWADKDLFAELMLAWELRSHRAAPAGDGPVFFDRGVVDVIGYLRLEGRPVPPHVHEAALRFRYHRRVFAAPPWPEIYRNDAERKQSPEEAERTYAAVTGAYADYGYELVTLPKASLEDRLAFLLGNIPLS